LSIPGDIRCNAQSRVCSKTLLGLQYTITLQILQKVLKCNIDRHTQRDATVHDYVKDTL
jgi:hypothetical protein